MGDVLTTLVQLAYVSAVCSAALQVIFDTRLYQINFGKGPNGEGNHTSRWFKQYELRPWVAMALGIAIAYQFDLTMIIEGLEELKLADLIAVSGEQAVHVDRILTGLTIGGGAKTIKALAKNFAETRKELKSTIG